MEVRTLRYFLAVVDEGTVVGAAESMHITQPSMSRQLAALERELGLSLFRRERGRLSLSAAGRLFLPVARDLVGRADAARDAARTIAAGGLETVRISAPRTTMTDVLAPFIATLDPGDPWPDVRLVGASLVGTAAYEPLSRDVDLAVGTSPPPAHRASVHVAAFPVLAYVAPTHRWAGQGHVELAELVTEPLLLLPRTAHPRRALDAALEDSAVSLGAAHEIEAAEIAQALTASGRGVSVVTDDPRFGLVPLTIKAAHGFVHVDLYAAWRADHHAADALADLADRLRSFCARAG